MSDSTHEMRRHIVDRDLIPALGNHTLREVTSEDVPQLCDKIKKRGAPSTALHAREFIKLIYAFASLHGIRLENPAEEVDPGSIARLRLRDRSLTPLEIRVLYRALEKDLSRFWLLQRRCADVPICFSRPCSAERL
jgi:hypothetical protein